MVNSRQGEVARRLHALKCHGTTGAKVAPPFVRFAITRLICNFEKTGCEVSYEVSYERICHLEGDFVTLWGAM